jgi:hypothetical protein
VMATPRKDSNGKASDARPRFSDESYNLRIELDCNNFDPEPQMIAAFETAIDPLRGPTKRFPVSVLYVAITRHSHTLSYDVKTVLVLPGETMTTRETDPWVYTAFERCIRKLLRRTETHIAALEAEGERSKHLKGTKQELVPNREPDDDAIAESVAAGDYAEFRKAMFVVEEPLRKRIGRWVQRYPQIEQRIGRDLTIADMVEETFLMAFDGWEQRPPNVPTGVWLEQLIDRAITALAAHPEEELENISYARSLQDAEAERPQ